MPCQLRLNRFHLKSWVQVQVNVTEDQVVASLTKIIDLSSSMLGSARDGEWERAQELEQKRQQLFAQTFPLDSDQITDAAALTAQIQKIVDLDKQTMQLAAKNRKEFSGLISKLTTGRQAVAAYQKGMDR
jgi:hypothetical protein